MAELLQSRDDETELLLAPSPCFSSFFRFSLAGSHEGTQVTATDLLEERLLHYVPDDIAMSFCLSHL